ncbi:MAG: hypothetical protein CBB68_09595 [Rhodospirillaceae bacterium TMED8]|nr:hypothetical protein [Magnetovibrio sp.]OUT50113.1 MAG: hypothetical protein CBB68_09595 [Rhodospirillaceae bacterium TMED8]
MRINSGHSQKPEIWFPILRAADWALIMSQDMAQGFKAANYSVLMLLYNEYPEKLREFSTEISRKIDSQEPFVIIDMNMYFNFDGFPKNLRPWRFTWIGDNPIHHHKKFSNFSDQTLIGTPDRRYLDVYEALGFSKNLIFVPHAGPPPIKEPLPSIKRDIRILFAGNFRLVPGEEEWRAFGSGLDKLYLSAVDEAVENILENQTETFQAMGTALANRGISWRDLNLEVVANIHQVVESYVEGINRWRILSAFDGQGLEIVGEVSDAVARRLPNTTIHKFPGFREMLQMVGRSRVLVNSTPKFSGGSHDRICNGMARGSVIATTPSTYLKEYFNHGAEVFYFSKDLSESVNEIISRLEDWDFLDEMTKKAGDKYDAKHTWSSRAEELGEVFTSAVSQLS